MAKNLLRSTKNIPNESIEMDNLDENDETSPEMLYHIEKEVIPIRD